MAQANLTTQQRAQIASRIEVWGSIIEVQRWFCSAFGIHKKLSPNTIKTCHSKLIWTVLRKPYKSLPLTAQTQDNIDVVKQHVWWEPWHISSANVQKIPVYRILKKDLDFKPWKPIAVQEIFPEDAVTETFLNLKCQMTPHFKNIIWSEVAVFILEGSSIGTTPIIGHKKTTKIYWKNRNQSQK